ncbi:MAG TPA: DISARM system helicase DrmA [Sphingomicrobium sp.]|nr:DISARM system helicase DrmA [Sphingomicrobium sp.]
MNSVEVRTELFHRLRRDLVGPSVNAPDRHDDGDLAEERLRDNPSRWYLTGFIAPADESEEIEVDPIEGQDKLALGPSGDGPGGAAGDDDDPEPPSTQKRFLPSSIGLTAILPIGTEEIGIELSWGDYVAEPPLSPAILDGQDTAQPDVEWLRRPRHASFPVAVPPSGELQRQIVPDSSVPGVRGSGALEVAIQCRTMKITPPGESETEQNVISVFVTNKRRWVARRYGDLTFAFQVELALRSNAGFCPQHDLSRYNASDPDDRLADLHYRDVAAYAVGRNAAACFDKDTDGVVRCVRTTAMPRASVELVEPTKVAGVEFGMRALAELAAQSGEALATKLRPLMVSYTEWSAAQEALKTTDITIARAGRRSEVAEQLIKAQGTACKRIAAGIDLLGSDARIRRAFEIMNRAMEMAARQRNSVARGIAPDETEAPTWRPFQLAFILLNLSGLAQKQHDDRETVDLLFFPTGGGKTEAYLGLAAFSIALRRLTGPGLLGAGVSVIMRYTLRLLTLDQLGRAAGLVCALELLRVGNDYVTNGRQLLGDWPIEIGLWVGSDASPNVLGGKGNSSDGSAVKRVRAYKMGRDKRAPAPIKQCPWCGTAFTPDSFHCVPNSDQPRNLEVRCANVACAFTADRPLPIVIVDESIYRRLPAFIIATVDKFAALPWKGEAGAFFGHVDRYDGSGFYGAADPRSGKALDNGFALDPPDLIIQDELHLISGPLGTVAGLYEAAIDRLASRHEGGRMVRPKIVASTATVRRAHDQIKALFDRSKTEIFPPPGLSRAHSFFAETVNESRSPARWYTGIAAGGRGPKLVFLRTLTSILSASSSLALENGDAVDPYMSALCYFNALRELGGARRIVEDEVRAGLSNYGDERWRSDSQDRPFANRTIGEPLELTSRVSTDEVAEAKKRLERPFSDSAQHVDVALATNMISVGLDITRLGLMLVQGQPKTAAEYIQATSRVGRDPARPGLVLAVLNLHKPRDRMHFEQFTHFHESFYRAVEATSVTPWSARALDRALAPVVVALARHLKPYLTPSIAAREIAENRELQDSIAEYLCQRSDSAVVGGQAALRHQIARLFSDWEELVEQQTSAGGGFAYDKRDAGGLLHAPLAKELVELDEKYHRFTAGWSMRDVEPAVRLKPRGPDGRPIGNAGDLL